MGHGFHGVTHPLRVFLVVGVLARLIAAAPGEQESHLGHLLGLQGFFQQRANALDTAEADVVVGRVGHRLLAQPGNVGATAQVPVFGGVQRIGCTVRIAEGAFTKARQLHGLGQRDEEGFHADGTALWGLCCLGFDDRPARAHRLRRHTVPGRHPAPAFVHQRIGNDVVGVGIALVDERVHRDDQRQLFRIGQVLGNLGAQTGDAVQRIARPEHQCLQRIRVATDAAGQQFGGEAGRVRKPWRGRRIGLVVGFPGGEFGGFFIGHIAPQRRTGWLDHAGKRGQVVARPLAAVLEAAAIGDETALPVDIAQQRVDAHQRIGVVEAVAAHHAAVGNDRGALAVRGQLLGQGRQGLGRDAAGLGIGVKLQAHGFFPQQLQRGLDPDLLAADRQHGVNEQGRRTFGLVTEHRLARIVQTNEGIALFVALFFRQFDAQIGGAQETPLARMFRLHHDQMRRVGERGFAICLGQFSVRKTQEPAVDAFVLEQPADDGHGHRAIGSRADGQPATPITAGAVVGVGQHRVDHHVRQLALGARFGDEGALALERVAGLPGCRADKKHKLGIGKIGLAMRHGLHVAKQGTRTRTVGAATVRAVADEVEGAIRLLEETACEAVTTIVDAGQHRHLIDPWPERRLAAVDGRFQVAQGGQSVDMPFAKQVATVNQLLDQLVKGDRLPLTAVARTDALERRQDAIRRVNLLGHRVAASACRGAPGQALAVVGGDGNETLTHAGLHRQVWIGGQRAVGVARDPQHFA